MSSVRSRRACARPLGLSKLSELLGIKIENAISDFYGFYCIYFRPVFVPTFSRFCRSRYRFALDEKHTVFHRFFESSVCVYFNREQKRREQAPALRKYKKLRVYPPTRFVDG